MFRIEPKCEMCNEEVATTFMFLEGESGEKKWHFVGDCQNGEEGYWFEISGFFLRPSSTVDWFAHLHEKGWVDWNDFMDMIRRFRTATGSHGSLTH